MAGHGVVAAAFVTLICVVVLAFVLLRVNSIVITVVASDVVVVVVLSIAMRAQVVDEIVDSRKIVWRLEAHLLFVKDRHAKIHTNTHAGHSHTYFFLLRRRVHSRVEPSWQN